ncbi:DUF4169 family protein [Caenispirillum bisanense]|uniref:DUF4169 family protein n=1 Tax=Caenispirillum bisanense TaxID=414052 RepID=UPI0031D1CF9F
MAEIINLRDVRKRKAREEKERQAADNRIRYGRTKAEKRLTELENSRSSRELEGKRRADAPPDDPTGSDGNGNGNGGGSAGG